MGIGQFCSLFDVLNKIDPRGRETLVGLRASPAFNQRLDNAGGGDLLATAIENFLLQLSDQSISFVAQLDG